MTSCMARRRIYITTSTDVFQGFENPFTATRYHSLVIEKETLPDSF